MVNEAFSEFSFGFAVTSEWISRLGPGLVTPPEFPSTLREGQLGGGWDLLLNTPTICTYLQFKLSEHMVMATAGQFSSHNRPYFRFWLRNRICRSGETQHEMLIKLDQQRGSRVLYVVPGFSDERSWTRHYFGRRVLANSICFSPKELGPANRSENHCVSFESASVAYGYLHSEPIVKRSHSGAELNLAPFDLMEQTEPLSLPRLRYEREVLMKVCGGKVVDIEKPAHLFPRGATSDIVEWLSLVYEMAVMARSFLDATLLLVART